MGPIDSYMTNTGEMKTEYIWFGVFRRLFGDFRMWIVPMVKNEGIGHGIGRAQNLIP